MFKNQLNNPTLEIRVDCLECAQKLVTQVVTVRLCPVIASYVLMFPGNYPSEFTALLKNLSSFLILAATARICQVISLPPLLYEPKLPIKFLTANEGFRSSRNEKSLQWVRQVLIRERNSNFLDRNLSGLDSITLNMISIYYSRP